MKEATLSRVSGSAKGRLRLDGHGFLGWTMELYMALSNSYNRRSILALGNHVAAFAAVHTPKLKKMT